MIKSFNWVSTYWQKGPVSKSLYQETFDGVKRYPLSINKGTPWQDRSDLRVRGLVYIEVQNGFVVDVPHDSMDRELLYRKPDSIGFGGRIKYLGQSMYFNHRMPACPPHRFFLAGSYTPFLNEYSLTIVISALCRVVIKARLPAPRKYHGKCVEK